MKHSTLVTHPPQVTVPTDNRALVAPIYQSVKFTFDSVAETRRQLNGEREGLEFAKSNPTLRQLELTLAQLQGREACQLTASGAAVVNLTLLALCKQGDHVITFAEMYGPTCRMIQRVLRRDGVSHTLLSVEDLEGIEQALVRNPTRRIVSRARQTQFSRLRTSRRSSCLARVTGR